MTDRPQVFHLITRFLGGGAEATITDIVTGLDDYDFVIGHGADFSQKQIGQLEPHTVATKQFNSIRHYNPVAAVPAVLAVARYLHHHDFDIVHTNSTEAGIIGRAAASIANVPAVVHTVHGVPFSSDRNAILNRFIIACERVAARWTDQIISNANIITEEYLEHGIGQLEQYKTIYVGIDIDNFRYATKAADIDGSGIRLLSVGRLVEGKGFTDLLAAIKMISENISLYIVGDGPLYSELTKTIKEQNLGHRVKLLKYRNDIPAIMAACDIFVLPSYREGTPRVITEAMASGLPVVATDVAGIPEQIDHGETGFLISPGDVRRLAARLEQLITSEQLRQEFGTAGQQRAERFSRHQMLSDVDAVYQQVLPVD